MCDTSAAVTVVVKEYASTHRKALGGVQVLKEPVHPAGVPAQQVFVQGFHHEAHHVPVQLVAKQPGQPLRVDRGQQIGAGGRVATGTRRVQGLSELVGVGRLHVDGGPAVLGPRGRVRRATVLVPVPLGGGTRGLGLLAGGAGNSSGC